MNAVWKFLFEFLVMKLMWGPWNLLVGITWIITDDVADDVTTAHFMFGAIGTMWLGGTIGSFICIPQIEEYPTITILGLYGLCMAIYGILALCLKVVLNGRNAHIFSLP